MSHVLFDLLSDGHQELGVGGVEGNAEHEVLPHHDAELITQVVELTTLIHLDTDIGQVITSPHLLTSEPDSPEKCHLNVKKLPKT